MLHNQSHDRFVIKSSSASAFAADELHMRSGCSRIQFILRYRLSISAVIDLDDLRLDKQIQRIIDRPGRDMLRLARLLQLCSGEGLFQKAGLRQNHFPDYGGSHTVRLDIVPQPLQCRFI